MRSRAVHRARRVRTRVRGAAGGYARSRGDARDVRAVLDIEGADLFAIQRVPVRMRDTLCGTPRRVVVVTHEVVAADHLRCGEGSRLDLAAVVPLEAGVPDTAEVPVVVVDARVDDRDLHALAGDAVVRPGGAGLDVVGRGDVVALGERDLVDPDDAGKPRNRAPLAIGRKDPEAIQRVGERALDARAGGRDGRPDPGLLARGLDRIALASAAGRAVPVASNRAAT